MPGGAPASFLDWLLLGSAGPLSLFLALTLVLLVEADQIRKRWLMAGIAAMWLLAESGGFNAGRKAVMYDLAAEPIPAALHDLRVYRSTYVEADN